MADQRHRFEFARTPWRLFALGGVLALFVWRYVIPRALRTATATQPPDVASADKTRQLSPKTAFEPTDWSLGPVAWVYVGTAILLVEQNVSRALGMVQRAYVLESGKVIIQGSSAELANNKQVQAAYLGI